MRAAVGAVGLLVTGLAIGGCSKVTTAANIASGPCSITLSGAVLGTYNCAPDAVAFNTTKDTSGYGFTMSDSTNHIRVTTAIAWQGQPAATDYVNGATPNSNGGITLQFTNGSGWTWVATQAGLNAAGVYDLKVTSVGSSVSTSSGTAYASSGTLTGTLVPVNGSGASGNVDFTVTF